MYQLFINHKLSILLIHQITYITSFGGEDELISHSKISINFNKVPKGTLGSELVANRLANAAKMSAESVSYADKVKQNLEKLKHLNDHPKSPRKPLAYQRRTKSRSRSRSKSTYHKNYRSRNSSRYRRSRSSSRRYAFTGHAKSFDKIKKCIEQKIYIFVLICFRHRTYRRSRSRDRHRRRYSTSSSSSSSSSPATRRLVLTLNTIQVEKCD